VSSALKYQELQQKKKPERQLRVNTKRPLPGRTTDWQSMEPSFRGESGSVDFDRKAGRTPGGNRMQGEHVWGLTGATGSSQKKRIPFAALRAKDRSLCVLCAFRELPRRRCRGITRTFSLHGLAGS
jgi:hypothetical protein